MPGQGLRRILMVLDHRFPPDIRVLNEAFSLVEAGHEVCVLSIGPDDRPEHDMHRGIRIIRRKIPMQLRNKMRGLAGTIPLLTQYLRRVLPRVHRQFPFDALHMHDLYMLGGGLAAGHYLKVPVIADLHENWVQVLSEYAWSTRLPGRLFVSTNRWYRLEKHWLSQADRVIVVVKEAKQRVMALGIPPSKLTIVPNVIKIEDFEQYEVEPDIIASIRSPYTIVYTGGIDLHRGLETLVRSLPRVLKAGPVRLVIVGEGSTRGELQLLARDLGVAETHYIHWLEATSPNAQLYSR